MVTITRLLGFICCITLTGSACAQQPNIPLSGSNQSYEFQLVTKEVDIPWGMAWLNQKDILVTDRKGA